MAAQLLGLGRGTELYPLPDLPSHHALVVSHRNSRLDARGVPISRACVDFTGESPILREFQTIAWTLNGSRLDQLPLKNDFEEAGV